MRVAYLMGFGSLTGDRFQGETLVKHLDFIPLNSSPIQGGKSGVTSIPSAGNSKLYYAINSLRDALSVLKPDIFFVHTVSSALAEEIGEIAKRYVTVLRLGVNFEELFLESIYHPSIYPLLGIIDIVDCVIAPSVFVKKNIQALGARNVVHIPTCVDLLEFLPVTPTENNILMVGRLGLVKNQLVPIMAMKKVIREVPDAKLLILGDGKLKNFFHNLATTLGLTGTVKLLGYGKSRKLYQRGKIFVQPSISENMSLTVLEALSSGLPIVASNIGGHKVADSITYVEHDDINGFAEAMINLLTDTRLWIEKHKQTLIEREKYDVRNVGPQYLELFSKLLKLRETFKVKA